MLSSRVPRKPRITAKQGRTRVDWYNEHLSWSVQDRSKMIFSDENNYQVFNRSNRIYFRRFRALIEHVFNGHRSELIEEEVSVSGHLLLVMIVAS